MPRALQYAPLELSLGPNVGLLTPAALTASFAESLEGRRGCVPGFLISSSPSPAGRVPVPVK